MCQYLCQYGCMQEGVGEWGGGGEQRPIEDSVIRVPSSRDRNSSSCNRTRQSAAFLPGACPALRYLGPGGDAG